MRLERACSRDEGARAADADKLSKKTGQEDEISNKEGCLRFEVSGGYSALWSRAFST